MEDFQKTTAAVKMSNPPSPISVGIVGGGMTGLYSALLLQNYIPGVKVKIFEANKRVGGDVFTYHFSEEPNQFFEVGAMRLPEIESHKPVFQLIDYLNSKLPSPIKLIEYHFVHPEGNRVFVNGTKQKDGRIMSAEYASMHYNELGFPSAADCRDATTLLREAMLPLIDALEKDFYGALVKYDMSVYDYLSKEMGWNEHKINYVEVMCGQTHHLRVRLLDFFFLGGSFLFNDSFSWKTIDGGLSNLPKACMNAIVKLGGEVYLNSKVESIIQAIDKASARVGYTQPGSKGFVYESFDAVLLTISPADIRAIPERPQWNADLEKALRTAPALPSIKLGLRFHSRFWERSDLQLPASRGGQSMTDLPVRWVVYPSNGIGDSGMGVLLIHNRQGDALQWMKMSKAEKIKITLSNLQLLYPEVNIAQEYAGGTDQENEKFLEEAFEWLMSSVLYNSGQLSSYAAMIKPQGNIYFAGVHLSSTLVWIVGALESAKRAVQQIAYKNYEIECIDFLY